MDGDTLYLVNRLLEIKVVCKVEDIVSIDYDTFMSDIVIALSNHRVIHRHRVDDPIKILDAFANILYGKAIRKRNPVVYSDIPNPVSLITDDDTK
jgi:hypothetical protein